MTTTAHLPGWTGTTRERIVDGLRALADELAADERLPLGKYADRAVEGIFPNIMVSVDSPAKVVLAAAVQDTLIDQHTDPNGARHTTTHLRFGAVTLHVYCLEPARAVTPHFRTNDGARDFNTVVDVDPTLQGGAWPSVSHGHVARLPRGGGGSL